MRRKILVAVLAASLLFVAAPAAAQDVSVNAESQATAGDNVTIDSVEMDDDGWVAVYSESVDGGPNFDDLKGAAEVGDGEQDDVVVETDGLDENAFYYAVLHYEEEDSGEFNYPGDGEVTYNDSTVQDDFFVAVGTRDILQSYADAKQQQRSLREQADLLEQQLDDLQERSEDTSGTNDELQDQIDSVSDDLESTRDSLDEIDGTIQETEQLLQQLEENETDTGGSGDDTGGSDGNETDGNESNGNTSDGDEEQPEGLPGFTAVAAIVALAAAVFLNRRD